MIFLSNPEFLSQTDGRKAMHKSPPRMGMGGLKNSLPKGLEAATTESPGKAWAPPSSGTKGLGYMGSRGWGVFTGAELGVAIELKSVVVAVVRVNVTGVDREWCRTAGAELLRSWREAGVGVLAIMESALLVEVGTLDMDTRRRTLSKVCRGAEIGK